MEKVDKKDDEFRRKVIFSSLLIVLLIGLVVGFSFAVFYFKGIGQKKNTISTGELTFTYTEENNGITLTDALPVSDEIGKKMQGNDKENKYFDFSVSCKMSGRQNIQYEVYTTEVGVDNRLDPQYVKMYLTDSTSDTAVNGYDKIVPTYSELKNSSIATNAKQLYVGKFSNSGTQSFRLRMWLSDNYQITSEAKQFKIKLNVLAKN